MLPQINGGGPRKPKGFTLVELLIVIAILGILASAVLVAINPGKRTGQARDAQRKSDINAIANSIIGYAAIVGQYPREVTCDSSKGTMAGGGNCTNVTGGGTWITFFGGATNSYLTDSIVTNQAFLKILPVDPKNDDTHYYRYEPFETSGRAGDTLCWVTDPGPCGYYWIGTLLEEPADSNYPIFRCTDVAAIGVGCKEVRCEVFGGQPGLHIGDDNMLDPANEC